MRGPLARKHDLIVRLLDGELCVYDVKRHRAHSLGPKMAALWRRCDGRTSVAELARTLALDEDLVAVSLERLGQAELLAHEYPRGRRTASRRQWLKEATALGLAIATITVPTLAEAASTISNNDCNRRPTDSCGGIRCVGGGTCIRVVTGGTAHCRCV